MSRGVLAAVLVTVREAAGEMLAWLGWTSSL